MPPIAAPAQPSPPNAALLAIEQVSGFLRIARILIEDRRRIDLAGLDSEIGRLCAAVLDLDPAIGRSFKPRLFALLAEVETIEARLAAWTTPPA